jgi:Domain of unknown function (DUF3127)
MALEITGTITNILDVQTGQKKDGSGTWEKQLFLVETKEQYNNLYCFEIFGDQKVDNFKKFNKVGQEVMVEFNVSCNEWQGKYFTTLSAWKITATPLQTQTNPQEFKGKQEFTEPLGQENEDSDLPF